jgi:hypothetical protein
LIGDPVLAERLDGRTDVGARGIEERGETHQGQLALVGDAVGGLGIHRPRRDGEHAEPVAAQMLEERVGPSLGVGVERLGTAVEGDGRAPRQDALRRALDHERAPVAPSTTTETQRREKSNGTSSMRV